MSRQKPTENSKNVTSGSGESQNKRTINQKPRISGLIKLIKIEFLYKHVLDYNKIIDEIRLDCQG
jgi:hypothetical protein